MDQSDESAPSQTQEHHPAPLDPDEVPSSNMGSVPGNGSSSDLESSVAMLFSSIESWKASYGLTASRSEERLLRALESLEVRLAQSQAATSEIQTLLIRPAVGAAADIELIVQEVRDALQSSAAWLSSTLNEWRTESAQGAGQSEERLLTAINEVQRGFEHIQQAADLSRIHLEAHSSEVNRALSAELAALKTADDDTRRWLEAAVSGLGGGMSEVLDRLGSAAAPAEHVGEVVSGRLDGVERALAEAGEARQATRTWAQEAVSALQANIEEWKSGVTESARTTQTRMLRALEALDEGITAAQGTGTELQAQVKLVAAALSQELGEARRTFDDAALRHEDALSAAVEGIQSRLGTTEETLISALEGIHERMDRTDETGAEAQSDLKAGLATVKAVEDETRQWLEAAATALASDVQGGMARLREISGSVDQVSSSIGGLKGEARQIAAEFLAMVNAKFDKIDRLMTEAAEVATGAHAGLNTIVNGLKDSVEDWKTGIADSALKTEARLVRALEALEESITLTQEQANLTTAELTEKIDGTQRAYEQIAGRQEQIISRAMVELQSKIMEALDVKLASVDLSSLKGGERLEELVSGLTESVEAWSARSQQEARVQQTSIAGSLESLELALSRSEAGRLDGEQALASNIAALEVRLEQVQKAGLEQQAKVTRALEDLGAKLSRQDSLESSIGQLAEEYGKLDGVRKAILELAAGQDRQDRIEETVTASQHRLEELAAELAAHPDGGSRFDELSTELTAGFGRQEEMEGTVATLVAAIDNWRDQGREAAVRSKERMAASLEALENRILETHNSQAAQTDLVRQEIAELAQLLERLKARAKDQSSTTIMRGLEELDEGLAETRETVLETRESISGLSETFEAQLELLEHRVADKVSDQLREFERAIQDRDRALARLMLGPQAEATPAPAGRPGDENDPLGGRRQRGLTRRP